MAASAFDDLEARWPGYRERFLLPARALLEGARLVAFPAEFEARARVTIDAVGRWLETGTLEARTALAAIEFEPEPTDDEPWTRLLADLVIAARATPESIDEDVDDVFLLDSVETLVGLQRLGLPYPSDADAAPLDLLARARLAGRPIVRGAIEARLGAIPPAPSPPSPPPRAQPTRTIAPDAWDWSRGAPKSDDGERDLERLRGAREDVQARLRPATGPDQPSARGNCAVLLIVAAIPLAAAAAVMGLLLA